MNLNTMRERKRWIRWGRKQVAGTKLKCPIPLQFISVFSFVFGSFFHMYDDLERSVNVRQITTAENSSFSLCDSLYSIIDTVFKACGSQVVKDPTSDRFIGIRRVLGADVLLKSTVVSNVRNDIIFFTYKLWQLQSTDEQTLQKWQETIDPPAPCLQ